LSTPFETAFQGFIGQRVDQILTEQTLADPEYRQHLEESLKTLTEFHERLDPDGKKAYSRHESAEGLGQGLALRIVYRQALLDGLNLMKILGVTGRE
jgi:hypothetical protein